MIRKYGFYELILKRVFDIAGSLLVLFLFWWAYIIVALLVRFFLGTPIIFKQVRPGLIDKKSGKERLFYIYKFRTMSDKRDSNDELLPDDQRLNKFGTLLRSSSMDELPEIINILKGEMSFVGPRPQLVRDMVFMSDFQRRRHTAKPGLTGLAQVKGRNAISWEEKLQWDLEYLEQISFLTDITIILSTFKVALFSHEGITDGKNATALDYGDVLLREGVIDTCTYEMKQKAANELLKEFCSQ